MIVETDLESRKKYFHIENFEFENGQILDELKLHYITLGTPRRGQDNSISNAVLLLHNTGGSAQSWLNSSLGGELFGTSQVLDKSKYFLIIPDAIGFGESSKPSDGLKAEFPNYRYSDIIIATQQLLTEDLGVDHLHLLLGISMGGMLAWMWVERYPESVNYVIPIACQPGPMSGRNWLQRRIAIEAIRNDPGWKNGNYEENPSNYLHTAPFSTLMTQSVIQLQDKAPTRKEADEFYREQVERAKKGDANDRLYQIECCMDYDPSADLEKIKAKLLLINFADDVLNPPEINVVEPAIAKLPNAQHVLVPASPETRGHLTNSVAAVWAPYVKEFLAE